MNPSIASLALLCLAALSAPADTPAFSGMSYLDNGNIKLGINLDIGGAITYVSKSGTEENIVNSHDWGRQIQMSFYSGPTPFEPGGRKPNPTWAGLGWNPIQSGDCYDNTSKVIAHKNDGTSIYVKCIPMQWPMNNEPGECTFECWIRLEGNTALVRSQINNAREDKTQYPARGQELPAIYTNGTYYRLFTYDGDAPFTGAALRQITKVWDTSQGVNVPGGPWDHWYATENWAALVNEDDVGLGVWAPGSYSFCGGFAGKPGQGGPKDGPTGYIAPLRQEILDHNIEYSYDYVLVVGPLQGIRDYVYEHAQRLAPPSYVFVGDRQSWTLRQCHDAGWPLDTVWAVTLEGAKPTLVGPHTLWKGADAPRLYVRAAFDTGQTEAILGWERLNAEAGEIRFDIDPGGVMRTYEIDLSASPAYQGLCTRLLLRAPHDKAAGRNVRVASIGFSPPVAEAP